MKKLSIWFIYLALSLVPVQAAGPTTQAVNSPASTLTNLTARAVDLHVDPFDVGHAAMGIL